MSIHPAHHLFSCANFRSIERISSADLTLILNWLEKERGSALRALCQSLIHFPRLLEGHIDSPRYRFENMELQDIEAFELDSDELLAACSPDE